MAKAPDPAAAIPAEHPPAVPPEFRTKLDTAVRNIREAADPTARTIFANRIRVRRRLSAIFYGSYLQGDNARAKRLASCGRSQLIFTSDDRRAMAVTYTCAQRICPDCSRRKSTDRLFSVIAHLAARPLTDPSNLRWITLTLRDRPVGQLRPTVAALLKAAHQLRRSKPWAQHVAGVIWNLEITLNQRRKTWHPHIHLVYDGTFWPWHQVKATWRNHAAARGLEGNATLGRVYVLRDGRKMTPQTAADLNKALAEVTKYNLKPFDSLRTPAPCIVELVHALHNKRTWGSSGTLAIPPAARPISARWYLLGGLGHLLEDSQSLLWTDPVFSASLTHRFASLPEHEILDLVDAYPLFHWILNPPDLAATEKNT